MIVHTVVLYVCGADIQLKRYYVVTALFGEYSHIQKNYALMLLFGNFLAASILCVGDVLVFRSRT